MSIVICLLASSGLVSIFKCLVSIFKWSELHTVVKSLIQFKPFPFTSNSSLIWNVEVPKEGRVALVLLPVCSKWELNPAVTWYGQTIPSWMFTFASNGSPQGLLSQEYVLHLLPWAKGPTQGRSPSGRVVGTVSIYRSTSIRLRVREHFLLLASTPDKRWSWGPLHLAWGWDREPYR